MTRSTTPSVFLPRLDDSKGPAWVLSEVAEHALVRAAMGKCGFEERPGDDELESVPGEDEKRRPQCWRLGLLRLGTVVLLVGASTAAAALAGKVIPATKTPVLVVTEAALAAGNATVGALSKNRSSLDLLGCGRGGPCAPWNDLERLEEEQPRETSRSVSASVATTKAPREHLSSEPIVMATPMALPPEDALRAANALRARRKFDQALTKYLQVVREHPDSAQALAARVAAATLRLEYAADPMGARELLLAQTERKNSIPEALFLLSRTYRSSGDTLQEMAALREFFGAHPDHPMAAKAKRRWEVLTALTDEEPAYQARF